VGRTEETRLATIEEQCLVRVTLMVVIGELKGRNVLDGPNSDINRGWGVRCEDNYRYCSIMATAKYIKG